MECGGGRCCSCVVGGRGTSTNSCSGTVLGGYPHAGRGVTRPLVRLHAALTSNGQQVLNGPYLFVLTRY